MSENLPYEIIRAAKITEAQLCQTAWRCQKNHETELVIFNRGGTIGGVKTSIWESFWRLENRTLIVSRRDGRIAYQLELTNGTPLTFEGEWVLNPNLTVKVKMVADEHAPRKISYQERTHDRIIVEQRFGAKREFILVTINSLGKLFDGDRTDWEMHKLPIDLSTDYLRISSTETPRSWYIDKVDRIMPILRSIAAMGYKRIVFVGMSAGGYASIVFAEMLSKEYPDIEINTVVFNPSLLLSPIHFHFYQTLSAEHKSSTCAPEVFATRQFDPADIDEILRLPNHGKVRHEIHFDALNPFETYQIDKIRGLGRIDLVAHDLGVNHGRGTIEIYNSGAVLRSIVNLLP